MTEVIILCQGNQSRLGMEHGHKQLLSLPACRGVPILLRTLAMVRFLTDDAKITLVGWPEMFVALRTAADADLLDIWRVSGANNQFITLPDPGNSSLKGIARYLESRDPTTQNRTLVLLGDVVYSWACLQAILGAATAWGSGFVGTADLRPDGGELWGLGWDSAFEVPMILALRDALLSHPPFSDTYQPGQLRRWLCPRSGDMVGRVAELRQAMRYAAIDDYTMDVDLPRDIPLLAGASQQAAADDRTHGLIWNRPT